jgi:ABC-type branched-subunit amino acid transport system permease subunit
VALLWGTLAACFAGAVAAWLLMRPMKNPYRQGMFAIVTLFATFMFSTLTMAADRTLGRPGLAGLALVALLVCLWIKRRLQPEPSNSR